MKCSVRRERVSVKRENAGGGGLRRKPGSQPEIRMQMTQKITISRSRKSLSECARQRISSNKFIKTEFESPERD